MVNMGDNHSHDDLHVHVVASDNCNSEPINYNGRVYRLVSGSRTAKMLIFLDAKMGFFWTKDVFLAHSVLAREPSSGVHTYAIQKRGLLVISG